MSSNWNGRNAAVATTVLPATYRGERSAEDVAAALARLALRLDWGHSAGGPFANVIRAGDRVVVKPNWVLHENLDRSRDFDPLVTHGLVIRAVVEALLQTPAGQIVVGDAPVQSCDFDRLIEASGLREYFATRSAADPRLVAPIDFRRTVSSIEGAVRTAREDARQLSQYVLFDLRDSSYLEPITAANTEFRVTQYPPDLMKHTHAAGRHQYLVAKEIVDADVIINMPKLKTHKKAGVTCALKNLVGINGNKEFLPHHRIGGPAAGGDCYPEDSIVKRSLEAVLDASNSTSSAGAQRAYGALSRVLYSIAHRTGDVTGVEGAWSGNDTVWRMCLDLNRVVLFGRADGSIANERQRRVVNVVDAIIAGQGDGPLAPKPLPLGLLIGGESSAAIDWIGARMLGYDPARIPIATHAYDPSPWPLADFPPSAIAVLTDSGSIDESTVGPPLGATDMKYPAGWLDAVRPATR